MAVSARQIVLGKWSVTHCWILHLIIIYNYLIVSRPGLTLDEAGAVERELRPGH
jgi:hypothetical protein